MRHRGLAVIVEKLTGNNPLLDVDRLLPKPLFPWSKQFFDTCKARSMRCQNSSFGLKELTSLIFRFAKSLLAKNVLMTVQGDSPLGNSPLRPGRYPSYILYAHTFPVPTVCTDLT